MAVTHGSTVRQDLANTVVGALNSGTLVFQSSGTTEIATLTFSTAAYAAPVAGVSTNNAITQDSSATGGTITKAVQQTSTGASVVLCSVTASGGGGDIELNSVIVSAGQAVSLTSLSYTAPV